jgi:branched-subunit amino acid ABC-type transport system permease component
VRALAEFIIIQTLNGLVYGVFLFTMALGLSLIFGLMGLVNLAHGSFFLLGAYLGLTIWRLTGNFWAAFFIAPITSGVIGIILEKIWFTRFYQRSHTDHVLLTLGLSFVFADIAKFFWGVKIEALPKPSLLNGSINIIGTQFPIYRIFVISLGIVLFLLTWLFISRTKIGALIRAAVLDRDMVIGLGYNVRAIFTVMFGIGVFLAAFGGILAAPITSIYIGLDLEILIIALIVVTVGGLGNIHSVFWASLLIGLSETFGKTLFPELAMFLNFIIMAFVLIIRSYGQPDVEEHLQ